jgi:hypothetical protein
MPVLSGHAFFTTVKKGSNAMSVARRRALRLDRMGAPPARSR